MTRLISPSTERFEEFCEVVRDFDAAHMDGSGFWGEHQPVFTPEGYAAWVRCLQDEGDEFVPANPGRVKCSYFWIVDDDDRWVGFLALRRSLNDFLLEQGGHIGYSVRPSRRREGHASRALVLALDEARALGLDRVLITCDEDNAGSRAVIEGAGGVYDDSRHGKRRYWIDLR